MAEMLRVRFASSGFSGGPWLNTFYFQPVGGTATQDEATEASARVRAFFADLAGIDGIFCTGWTGNLLPGVDVLNPASGTLVGLFDSVDTAAVNGAGSFALGPANATIILRQTTEAFLNGRRLQGRANIGPVRNGISLSGQVASATRTFVQVTADSRLDATIDEPITHAVWHRPKTSGDGSLHTVVQYSVPPEWGTLRSRRD